MAFDFSGIKPANNNPPQPTTQPQTPPQTSPLQYNGAISQEQFNAALQNISRRFGIPIQPDTINQQFYNQICQQYGQVQQNPNALQQLQKQALDAQNNQPFNNKK